MWLMTPGLKLLIVGQASPPVEHVGQPFQAVVLTGWKAGPTGAPPFTPERSRIVYAVRQRAPD